MQLQRQPQRLSKANQNKTTGISVSSIEPPSSAKTQQKKRTKSSPADKQTKKSNIAYAPDVDFEPNSCSKTRIGIHSSTSSRSGLTPPLRKLTKSSSSLQKSHPKGNTGMHASTIESSSTGIEVTRIEQIDENFIGFVNEPFTRVLDTNNEYHGHDCVDVIGTVVAIGNIVPVNGYGCSKMSHPQISLQRKTRFGIVTS
ncbi:hypothetical protein Tco_1143496 [Tanacetum coccineum]